jgi:glycosyltransferase involved in cell wall biosynthesis
MIRAKASSRAWTWSGRVSEQQKLDHYARCRAVYFAPKNEDYGFITLEAMSSSKAVLTASDSGGPTEQVVERQVDGLDPGSPQAAAFASCDRPPRRRSAARGDDGPGSARLRREAHLGSGR